jgi:hypothetical protein
MRAFAMMVAAGLALSPMSGLAPALAHHGWSSYEATAVKISGPVKALRYQNPHGEIEMEYEGATWVIVLAPVSRMQARGLPQDLIAVGTAVEVEAYPIKSGDKEMRAERITVNGKTVELR